MHSNTAPDPSINCPSEAAGSRRRRLWDLPSQALCPVIGVCLPMPLLRRRLGKLLGGAIQANDYEVHCGVIKECQTRSPVAESLQRELEQRFIRTIRLATQEKTTSALAHWWAQAREGHEVAASLWATLTHARCDTTLQEQVLQDIHMLQHQLGSANRADLQKMQSLNDENGVLTRELARVQERSTRLLQERSHAMEQQAAELLRMRAALLGRDTLIEYLKAEIQELEAAVPGLKTRQQQSQEIRLHLARIADLERSLLRTQQQLAIERQRAAQALSIAQPIPNPGTAPDSEAPSLEPAPQRQNQAVLCVGGRQAAVPIYRQLIERTGGRFLHHDGGEEDAAAKLDASLAAADLVICQTGCISHDAYWRVKEHCKRLGKRCVFVDKPSSSSLRRALTQLMPADSGQAREN